MLIKTITQVTQIIKALLDEDEELQDLWVEGEVSNFSRASSGHCYFTLKDQSCELRCVMWRNQASRLAQWPAQGDWVEAHGYISVYERGGAYQFYAETLTCGGVGARWREFQELKERLQAEGLFDEARKRPLPAWPRRIGVVTSPTGAAFQDILNVLRARYPLVEVVLSPSLVQGAEAPESLVRAIERLNQTPDIDVVIVARGGGSLEDLWAFNDERVARAVAGSHAPVVSGVGHEVDFTIVDFVADLRAPTPSVAAASVVPDGHELSLQLHSMAQALNDVLSKRLSQSTELLHREERLLRTHDPRRTLAEQRQRVDDLFHQVNTATQHRIELWRTSLARFEASLQALNPRTVLERGYAIVRDGVTLKPLSGIAQFALGQEIDISVHDGCLGARVMRTRRQGNL